MDYKWIGAILIVAGCGGFGFSLSSEHRTQENSLRKLIAVLDFMTCELRYRMTPMPELCTAAGKEASGQLGRLFLLLSAELDSAAIENVSFAMDEVLKLCGPFPSKTQENLILLGQSLGRFDLEGQLAGLETVRASCRRDLEGFAANRDVRLRNYQTLGLCAGAALAIVLI